MQRVLHRHVVVLGSSALWTSVSADGALGQRQRIQSERGRRVIVDAGERAMAVDVDRADGDDLTRATARRRIADLSRLRRRGAAREGVDQHFRPPALHGTPYTQ